MIRSIVADAIQNRLNDPRILPLTSITRVAVSDDFSLARIYVSVMAPDAADDAQRQSQRTRCVAARQPHGW